MNLTVNITANGTNIDPIDNVCVDTTYSKGPAIAKIFSLSLIMVVALVGNILVIYVVYKNKSLRRTINFFIVNIALSDLVMPLVVIPRVIVELARGDSSWMLDGQLGAVMCKLVYFLSDISPTVSITSLIFMTVDRFLAVVFPLRITLMNSRRRYYLIALTWLISIAVFSPYFYAMKVITGFDGKLYCAILWSPAFDQLETHNAYSTAISILFLVIPFFTLTILYSIILIQTKKQPDLIRNKTSEKARLRHKQTAKRVTLMAFLIVLIFGLCWGPYNILLFLLVFFWEWQPPTFCNWQSAFFAVKFLCYSNAAINPCVYFIFIKNFRRGLKNQLSKSKRLRQPSNKNKNSQKSLLYSVQTALKTNDSSAETCM